MIALDPQDRRELLRWVVCGAVVLMAHASIAAAMVQWREIPEPDDPAAAIVMELAPLPVAPTEVPSEIPPGPEQIQAEATPEQVVEQIEQKVEEKIEQAPNPEVALIPKQQKPEPPKEQHTPAPATTAPQAVPVAIAALPAAPTQGKTNPNNSNAIPSWKTQIVGILERNKRYPSEAQARHETGVVELAFSLDRQGRVVASEVVKSSGSSALDKETLDLVRRAQPFPPPPNQLAGAAVSLTVPIRFNIR